MYRENKKKIYSKFSQQSEFKKCGLSLWNGIYALNIEVFEYLYSQIIYSYICMEIKCYLLKI